MNPCSSSSWSLSCPFSVPVPVPPRPFVPESVKENMAFVFSQLLPNFLNHVPEPDLIYNCRLVSNSWRDESTLVLRRRKSVKCTFEYYPPLQRFMFKKETFDSRGGNPNPNPNFNVNVSGDMKTLTEFSQLLSCPFGTFPCSWIHFSSGSLNHPNSVEFFSAHGEKFTKLTMNFTENSTLLTGTGTGTFDFLTTRFFTLIPNVEILGFSNLQSDLCQHHYYYSLHKPDFPFQNLNQPQNQNQYQNQNPNQQHHQRPLLPRLNLVCWQSDVKTGTETENLQLSVLSQILNFLRSEFLAPQLSSLFIRSLELTSSQGQGQGQRAQNRNRNRNGQQNQNGGISILKTLTCKFNVKFGEMSFKIFAPKECRLSLIEAASELHLRTKSLRIENGGQPLQKNRRPSKYHFIRVRRALSRLMENTSDILEQLSCSFQVLTLLTRIPFPPELFQNLRHLSLRDETDGATLTCLNPNIFFRCGSISNSNSNFSTSDRNSNDFNFPRRPLWTDFGTVAPALKTIVFILSPSYCDIEAWLPFLDPPIFQHQHAYFPTTPEPEPEPETKFNFNINPQLIQSNSNTSVEQLEVSHLPTGSSLTPETLGQLIKCFPNLKEITVKIPKIPHFLPVLDQNVVSTLEELVCFLFGIEREQEREKEKAVKKKEREIPGFVKQEIKEECEYEYKSCAFLSSQAQTKMPGICLTSRNDDDDPIFRKIQTLLNLKKLWKLWVAFSLCDPVEVVQERKTETETKFSSTCSTSASTSLALEWNDGWDKQSTSAGAVETRQFSNFSAPSSASLQSSCSNVCFLDRIPNTNKTYTEISGESFSLNLSCLTHVT